MSEKMYTNDYQRKRAKQLKLRYTQAEYNEIAEGAKATGETMSNYVLRAVRELQQREKDLQANK